MSFNSELREIFEDWTIINTAKRLRGAMLHAARICRRHGQDVDAKDFERFAGGVPSKMEKEAINLTLMSIAFDFGWITHT